LNSLREIERTDWRPPVFRRLHRNPRVLVLNHFAAPRGQAGGTRHVELFGRLRDWDHLILAANRNYLTGAPVHSFKSFTAVPVIAYSANGLARIVNWASYALMAFCRGLTTGRVDVVYASSPHLLAALSGWALSVVKRSHFILEVRDLWPRVLAEMGQLSEASWVYRALTKLELFLYSRATRIVVLADGVGNDLVARGFNRSKIVYIPNGADPADFEPSGSRELLRAKYGFDKFTAVYAGAHGPANGLELLLHAAGRITSLPIDIVLVGGGVNKSNLQQIARSRGLSNVRFLDPMPKSEIPDLLCAADLGLHVLADVELFRQGVSPNKVFDYMAAGLPVLTNCPGLVSELVEASGCGATVAPAALAEGLTSLYFRNLEPQGRAGQEWISAHQSRAAMADRLSNLLSEMSKRGAS
jgi:glycosyltransferase involved in cell wall biosynthesis